jgi:hypothetical protein
LCGDILTEVNVKYDIPEDRLKEAIAPKKHGFLGKIKSGLSRFANWLHRNVRKFMILSALVLMLIMILILPNPLYSIGFDFVFSIILYVVFTYLIPMVILEMVDFKTNNTMIIKLSYHRLHDFKIEDCDHKPASFVYWLYAGKDRVFICDEIDFENDRIVLNPICCQLAYVKNFKEALNDMRDKLQITMNKYEKLKLYRDYEAMVKAGELNDMNPLNQIFTRKKARIDGEILSTDSIDEYNKNNIGKVN